MKVIDSLDTPLPSPKHPISLTIGTFDGMHLGHLSLLQELVGTKVVITFTNHPALVLHPNKNVRQLCSLDEKITLFAKAGIDFLYLFPFTLPFSEQSPRLFLERTRGSIPFDTLILGKDAVIGQGRAGTPDKIKELASEMHFEVRYVEDRLVDGKRPSSSLIRSLLDQNKIAEAESLLGRPYKE